MINESSNKKQTTQIKEQAQEQMLFISFINKYDYENNEAFIQNKWFQQLSEDTFKKYVDTLNKIICLLPKELVLIHIEKELPVLSVYRKYNYEKKSYNVYIKSLYSSFFYDNKIIDESMKDLLSIIINDLSNIQKNHIKKCIE